MRCSSGPAFLFGWSGPFGLHKNAKKKLGSGPDSAPEGAFYLFALRHAWKACHDTNLDAMIVDSASTYNDEGFVSGYGFSRIEKDETTIGFSRWPQGLKADRICSLRHA